jgi:predicted ATPase
MHLLSVKLNQNYRCLKIGLFIELKPITLLVGEQGCGKSSLLNLIQKNSDILTISLSDNAMKSGINSFFFDTEKMNPRTANLMANYTNPDGTNKGIGFGTALSLYFKSHGETLKEFTVNRIYQANDCVLLLDEPESALSLRNQYKLANELKEAINRNVQIIVSTHCLPIIESIDEVYSLEHLKWIKSQEFISINRI